MDVTVKGNLLPYLQSETWDFDPQRGYIYHAEYKGASQNLMLATQQDYARAGIACRLTFHQGGVCSLEIEDATQSFVIDSWQILGNQESRDGLSHPTVLSLASQAQVAAMRTHLANFDDGTTVFTTDPILTPLNGGDVPFFYELAIRGSEEYLRGQYVLRHTTNAPNRWGVNISDFGVDFVYTPSQLLSEAQNSALWIFPLPGRLAYKINSIPFPTFVANYRFGWLKGASTETTAANNRVDITQEYTLEQWSTKYYQPF